MSDNVLSKDRNDADIAIAAKDISGVLFPRNILTSPDGAEITPLTDEQLRASPISVSVSNFPAQSSGQTDAEMRASPVETKPSESTFLERLAFRALAKLTFTLTGARVDCGGSSVAIASGTVTTVTTATTLAGIGYNSQNGQAIQQSQLAVQCGFRRNIS